MAVRIPGTSLQSGFTGELLPEQKIALDVLVADDTGVLHAPPGFGKTVTAAAVIAQRGCSTLVIVHTTDLLRQWQSRLARASKGKHDVRVIDVHDTGHPMLESMWRKRRRGYRALGWRDATKEQLF